MAFFKNGSTSRRLEFDRWDGKITLEEEMSTHSIIHPWEIPWTEKPGGLQPIELQESDTT